jgi:hypothetical protein
MAIIKVRNPAIDLDAAEIPNLDASKITTGSFDASRIGSGTFADARIAASNVSQHATSFDDNKLVNDISTLALRQASDQNKSAYNTNSSSVDVFQDSTGITNLTNTSRNASEYIDTNSSVADSNTLGMWTTELDNATGNPYTNPITDATGTLELYSNDANVNLVSDNPFGSKAVQTRNWSNSSQVDYSFYIREKSGQTSNLNFGTGAFTIEMWIKRVNNSVINSNHLYILDFATALSTNRTTIAPYGLGSSYDGNSYNGSTLGTGVNYNWDNFPDTSWTHCAYVRDTSGRHAVLINGAKRANPTYTLNTTALDYTDSSYLGIGQRHNGDNPSYIRIADIRISNVARYNIDDMGSGASQSSYTVPSSRLNYSTSSFSATGSFEGTTITAPSSVSSMGAIITYQDQAGTNALNTDIVLQLSADGGSNYSTATLTALPDFSTGIKMAKVNDLSVTAGTSLKYKLSFANQASGTKEARIRGVALQY